MKRVRLGNSEVDREALSPEGLRIAIEVKTFNDGIVRGLGQLCEALAFGYDRAILVTTIRKTKKIDQTTFKHFGMPNFGQ